MIYRTSFGVPAWRLRGPFEELDLIRRQMDRLFDNLSDKTTSRMSAGVFPLINLTEDIENYYIRAELPGVAAGELDIQATANSVSISGERITDNEGNDVRYHRRERDAGKFSRVVTLPGDVESADIEAKMENGLLTVTVPKAEKAKPRQITVS